MAHMDSIASFFCFGYKTFILFRSCCVTKGANRIPNITSSNPLRAIGCNDAEFRGFLWTLYMTDSVVLCNRLRLLPSK